MWITSDTRCCCIECVYQFCICVNLYILEHTHILVWQSIWCFAAPFSDVTTQHTTDPATLLLTTIHGSTTNSKSEDSPTNINDTTISDLQSDIPSTPIHYGGTSSYPVSKAASTTIYDRITLDATSASVHNGTTPVVALETVLTSRRSIFIGIGVLMSIIVLMGIIIVIGVAIVILYVKKRYVQAIDTGQGVCHQLETPTQAKGT